jgi:hypothetical protein
MVMIVGINARRAHAYLSGMYRSAQFAPKSASTSSPRGQEITTTTISRRAFRTAFA